MIQLTTEIPEELAPDLDAHFCELEHSPWSIQEDRLKRKTSLCGYFDTEAAARNAFDELLLAFPQMPGHPSVTVIEDKDWKEAYKEHFKPWSAGNLHWVPTWERDVYPVPQGETAIYLDPGMAFGTGNHETTRLCAWRLVELSEVHGPERAGRSVIDAGCGSGILAISAAALGFSPVEGFDIDPDSVEIAQENAVVNNVAGAVHFYQGDLVAGLQGKGAHVVMANILANVLVDHRDLLLDAVLPGGALILSGILATEVDAVREAFTAGARERWTDLSHVDSRKDGEWADVMLER